MSVRREKIGVFGVTTLLWLSIITTIVMQVFPPQNANPWIPIIMGGIAGMSALLLFSVLISTDVKEVK